MPCFHPVPASQDEQGRVELNPPWGTSTMQVPCGVCIGCRKRRAREWAVRSMHEASFHEHNSFVTLTYDDANLPYGGDLSPPDLQKFLKRVRTALVDRRPGLLGDRMRFLACGEYGEAGDRPHYHALLFGVGFDDGARVGKDLFTSQTLTALWTHGHASFGSVTAASASYVAQYSLKKVRGSEWRRCSPDGVVLHQPFLRCSLRPGIGGSWLRKYATDTRHGYVVVDGKQLSVPRYYQKLLEVTDVGLAEESRENAAQHALSVRQSEGELAAGEVTALRYQELMNPRKFKL